MTSEQINELIYLQFSELRVSMNLTCLHELCVRAAAAETRTKAEALHHISISASEFENQTKEETRLCIHILCRTKDHVLSSTPLNTGDYMSA